MSSSCGVQILPPGFNGQVQLSVAMGPQGPAGAAGGIKAVLATTANITLSGEQVVDGTLTSTIPVLVKEQTDATENGVYLSASGAWARLTGFTTWAQMSGALVTVVIGTVNGGTVWLCDIPPTGTVGTDDITFVEVGGGGGGSGTVTSVSVASAAGVSGSVTNPTSTPVITIVLGNITPASVNAAGLVLGSNLQGTNTGDQTITLQGDVTGSGTGTFTTAIGAGKVTNTMLAGSITATKLVGTDIATVGTITTGTWNATAIAGAKQTVMVGDSGSGGAQGAVPAPVTGDATKVLYGDATWKTIPAATPGGSSGQVQYNNAGAFAGSSGMTYNAGTATLTLGQLVLATALPVHEGGTGSNSAPTALNNLLPSQTGNSGKVLATDGTNAAWQTESVQTITLTGDVTGSGTGTFAATIAANAVTNAKLATMATLTIKGNITGGTAVPTDLTATQVTSMLDLFTTTLKGLVPLSGGGTTNFLRADGAWAAPGGGGSGTVTSVSVVTANGVSGSVATATTTPAITIVLGAITPTSVAASGAVTGSNLSGTNTGDQTITLTSDVTGSGTGSFTTTIAVGAVTDAKSSLATKPSVTVVSIANQTLSGVPTIDGQLTVANQSVALLTAQSAPAENGPWVVQVGAWTRPAWYPTGGTTQAIQFCSTFVRLGTTYGGSTWRQTAAAPITIGTTAQTWSIVRTVINTNTVSGQGFPRPVIASMPGPRVVATDVTNWTVMGLAGTITKVWAVAKTGPTGAALIFDILKSTDNGATFTSIWAATPANRVQIAAAAVAGNQTSFDTTTFAAGDLFRFDIAQVGSSVAGSDITLNMTTLVQNS